MDESTGKYKELSDAAKTVATMAGPITETVKKILGMLGSGAA